METPQEQQPGNEESGRPIRNNTDVEGGTLQWSTGGKEGCLGPRDGKQRKLRRRFPKGPQN